MGLFDGAIRGIWGWLGGITGWWEPSPEKPVKVGLTWDQFKAAMPDGTFFLVHRICKKKNSMDEGLSDGIEAAEQGYFSHVVSGKWGEKIIEAIEEGLVWQSIEKYNDPSTFQLVAFVFPYTDEEILSLKAWFDKREGTPYPVQEIVHDATPIVPGVKDKWDCSGATACSRKECGTRWPLYPIEKKDCPEDTTPQEIFNICEPITDSKMIKWNW